MNDPLLYHRCSFAMCGLLILMLLATASTATFQGQYFVTLYESMALLGIAYVVKKNTDKLFPVEE